MSSSHEDYPCADASNVSFGPMAETTSPTSYEPKDLTLDGHFYVGQTDVLPQTEHDVDS